ncbi:MAG: UDP-N-acetylglucosamine 2-epimerase (non-hydrolyzing) [Candidatus Latescibacterota bacterium]|nr:MAG: UDP-N-acetylglucosamine 2-epimerase (non-hydrolyzing) [Candidatus Latescibacterota bacterium]
MSRARASGDVTLLSIVGARPNFMKVAPIARVLAQRPAWRHLIVHTGQHYDANMSKVFFSELGIPEPDVHLGVGSGTHAQQTARVMMALEEVIEKARPDMVIVVGDVNSTLAGALVAVKLRIPVAHVEAGLRSFDREMPEEINRVVTDSVADLLLTPSRDGDENLLREGVDPQRIHFVGNVMIDSLLHFLPRARETRAWARFGLQHGGYCLVTLHRPSNVDEERRLRDFLVLLERIGKRLPVLFPIHPRTRKMLQEFGLAEDPPGVHLVEPVGYLEFIGLEEGARLVLTDSGGIQEESTILKVPCLTLRANTERPVTVTEGCNRVVGQDPQTIWAAVEEILGQKKRPSRVPEKWDGRAAERIVRVIEEFLETRRSGA